VTGGSYGRVREWGLSFMEHGGPFQVKRSVTYIMLLALLAGGYVGSPAVHSDDHATFAQ
jgi:hypothetical protein